MKGIALLIQMLDEGDDASLITEVVLLVGAYLVDDDSNACIQKGKLAQALRKHVERKFGRLEYLGIRRKADPRAGELGVAYCFESCVRDAALVVLSPEPAVALDLDLQYVFTNGPVVIPYLGLGLGVQIRDASGTAIAGTFVEDALETIAAVLNVTAGFEVAVTRTLRLTADGRGMFSSGLIAASVRGGFMVRFPRASE